MENNNMTIGKWRDSEYGTFSQLGEDEQSALLEWIRNSLKPRKTALLTRTSYGLKHLYEADTGNYVTNSQFKDAMVLAGYEPVDPWMLNHSYSISKKSTAFNNYK